MPNDFYTPTGNPTDNSAIVSTDMRAEFAAINAGFNKLPTLTGNANKLVVINSSGTGMDVTLAPAGLTSVNKIALTQPATGATLTILDGKTLTANHSLTLAGADGTVMTFPATSASVARIDAAQTFEGVQDFNGRIDANAGLAVTGANFTSRGISDTATAVALTLSGSGANSVTIANSATVPVISTTAGSLFLTSAGQNVGLLVAGGAPSGFVGLTAGGTTPAGMVISGDIIALYGQGAEQARITGTASANRYITLTGSAGGNPTIGTSAGSLAISCPVVVSPGSGNTFQILNGFLDVAGRAQVLSNFALPAGGDTGVVISATTSNIGIYFGSGAPTVLAAKGSIYLRSDGSATNNRMYVNTDGSTTWTAVTTAA